MVPFLGQSLIFFIPVLIILNFNSRVVTKIFDGLLLSSSIGIIFFNISESNFILDKASALVFIFPFLINNF